MIAMMIRKMVTGSVMGSDGSSGAKISRHDGKPNVKKLQKLCITTGSNYSDHHRRMKLKQDFHATRGYNSVHASGQDELQAIPKPIKPNAAENSIQKPHPPVDGSTRILTNEG